MKEQNLFLCILSHGVNSSKSDLELLESKIEKLFNSAFSFENKDESKDNKFTNHSNRSYHNLIDNNTDNTIYIINSNCNAYIKSHYSIEVLAKNLLNEVKQNLENEILPAFEKKIISKYTKNNINEKTDNNTIENGNTGKANENKKLKYTEEEKKLLFEDIKCNLYISVLGHSLGGLILRYFIKLLYDKNNRNNSDSSESINDEIYNSLSFLDYIKQKYTYIKEIIPCSYISVATPHLGSCIPSIQTSNQLKSKITNGFQSLVFSTIMGDSGRQLNIPKNSLLGNILWRNNSNNNASGVQQPSQENKSNDKNDQKISLKGKNGLSGSRVGLKLLLGRDSKSNNSSTDSLNKNNQ